MPKPKPNTLAPGDIPSAKQLGRRSALAQIGAVFGGATAIVVTGIPRPAGAAARGTGYTDSDGGRYADPGGRGRSGITDSDGGAHADPAGHGRAMTKYPAPATTKSATDSDGGRWADPAGRGHGAQTRQGASDSDGGRWADPAGSARGGLTARTKGLSDSDRRSGKGDPAGRGRGRAVGRTDSDGGIHADRAKHGRGEVVRNTTDADAGKLGDPDGMGRRPVSKKSKRAPKTKSKP